jgi:hypothetical protein
LFEDLVVNLLDRCFQGHLVQAKIAGHLCQRLFEANLADSSLPFNSLVATSTFLASSVVGESFMAESPLPGTLLHSLRLP